MKCELIPVKGQVFNIGRTINPTLCDCKDCDFLHCPKRNYAVEMTRRIPTFDEFWDCWGKEIVSINKVSVIDANFPKSIRIHLTFDLITEMMECIAFPKETYWKADDDIDWRSDKDIGDRFYGYISIVKFNRRRDREIKIGEIRVNDGWLVDYDLNKQQEKLGRNISEFVKQIISRIASYYEEEYKDRLTGWLSPDGRHYKCTSSQHIELARRLGYSESNIENDGWLKLPSDSTYMGWFGARRPSAEQRNFLSLNGYNVEDL